MKILFLLFFLHFAPLNVLSIDSIHRRSLTNCPTGGIPDSTGSKCCPESCGICGGNGCDQRPGGVDACCVGSVVNSCSESDLPCVADDEEGADSLSSQSSSTDLTQQENDVCDEGGLLAFFRHVGSCEVRVCCPKTCPSCDTSFDCSLDPECCAQKIVENIHITDKGVSCLEKSPPCVLPPLVNPCDPNPCLHDVSCSIKFYFVAYLPYTCSFVPFCNCSEAGNYVGQLCETECNEDQLPCARKMTNSFGSYYYDSDSQCCQSFEECVNLSDLAEPNYETSCVPINGPTTCNPSPCLNNGFCNEISETFGYYSCICQEEWTGPLCETAVDG
mmetsp:Transcript_8381/g.11778  ORF Transcript_8381/g.11778 Transcript_8381/m.11778 type:complete len:331 (+) Transcript_8381:66-1058(+)